MKPDIPGKDWGMSGGLKEASSQKPKSAGQTSREM